MCIELAVMAATAATSVVSGVTGMANAKAQSAQNALAIQAEQARAVSEEAQIRQKQSQDKEALARDASRITIQAKQASASALTAAGESGMTGASVDALLADFHRQELNYLESSQRQSSIIDQGANNAIDAASKGSYFNQVSLNRPVSSPSYLDIGLGIANAGAQYGKDVNAAKAK